ncbi:hypothetical protein NP493_131g01028 [Ridgeia piscesae]|uniref:FAM69 N-terminal domain-containing protein n=1 Tax=Ridgeia piscesae TaxID=27915 RepID=A0AAD9UGC8_RIDPI|nr:hypothetical protein NP493_131g01028 [Ridgeia piscesae]
MLRRKADFQIFWRRHVNRPKYFHLGAAVLSTLVLFLLLPYLYQAISDHALGRHITNRVCEQYKAGLISGKLCDNLCNLRDISLRSFIIQSNGCRAVDLGETFVRVPYDYFLGETLPMYGTPEQGTRLEQFQRMVDGFLQAKLDIGDHSKLRDYIINLGDVNNDAKLSLAEAKTIWSLLQQNEFFVAVIFRAESHIPSVVDFCGAIYRTEYVNYTKLYEPDNIAMHRRWFGPRFPKWAARAKVVLGLLEFTMEAYQHGSDGSFYMCSTNSTNVGFTDAHDVKLLDTSKLLSHQDLRAFVGGKTCATSADCSYTPHCTTRCDTRAHTCTAELERPNLHLVCRIARPYILKNAPSDLHGSLLRILARCSELSAHLTGVELQHSLVLNDFKSLLWKAIM